jgi:uncharacterized protein YodC (DUF2158 family)
MGRYEGPIWEGLVFEIPDFIRTVTEVRVDRVYFDSVGTSGKSIGTFDESTEFFRAQVTRLLPPPDWNWSAYVPKTELPNTGAKTPKIGEIWAFNNGAFSGVGRYQKNGRTLVFAGKNRYKVCSNEEIGIQPTLGYCWAVRLFEAPPAQRELAPGWERCSWTTAYVCTDKSGNSEGLHSDGASRRPVRAAVYIKNGDTAKMPGSCEACAAYHGVFAGSDKPDTLFKVPTTYVDLSEPFGIKRTRLPDIDLDEPALPKGTMPPNRSEWRVMADLLDKDGEKYLGTPVKTSRMEKGRWYFLPSKKGDTSRAFGGILRVKKTGDRIGSKLLALMSDNSYLDSVRDDFRFDVNSEWGESDWRPILAFPDRSLYATTEPKTTEAWESLAAFLTSNAGDPPWLGSPVTSGRFEEDQLYFCVPQAGELFGSRDEATAPRIMRVTSVAAHRVYITALTNQRNIIGGFDKRSPTGLLHWRPIVRLPRPEQYTVKASVSSAPAGERCSGGACPLPAPTPAGIKVGDVVRLVSGGPKMTVVEVANGYADVAWFFTDTAMSEHVLPVAALVKE